MSLEKQLVDPILNLIIKKFSLRGLDLQQYKTSFLKRRIDARIRVQGLDSYLQYVSLLDKDPSEYTALFKSISINVTSFFRDKEVFSTFSNEIIPKLLSEKSKSQTIRVWSAGCATGEEAYSLAILLYEKFVKSDLGAFKVYATDISAKAVETAKIGRYTSDSLKNVSNEFLAKYFHVHSNGEYQVHQEIKNYVTFNVGDIAAFPITYLDVIFCRNILIYIEKETQYSILQKFHFSLKTSSYLVLGMDESIRGQQSHLFKSILPRQRIYQKQ
ncbi:MAG: protein-glutamate O-methyltransferase CheR [Thaumarchaeota archaeon]|nr:protein-glutamate O-methyltransferase CheR [Nitrososphaerota archaeon]MBI3641138.1 protein-glutamate O-methyltransferase CheR [Nitrososphaerota archaeon]